VAPSTGFSALSYFQSPIAARIVIGGSAVLVSQHQFNGDSNSRGRCREIVLAQPSVRLPISHFQTVGLPGSRTTVNFLIGL
jgi:hypothetical protein